MGIKFNADEIFQIAERIEKNGAHFYREAAKKISDEGTKRTFLKLADMEDRHQKAFAAIRQDLSAKEKELAVFDPEGQLKEYLDAMAGGYVFNVNRDPTGELGRLRTAEAVLRKAIEIEKDSIVFYIGISDLVPESLGKGRVDDIIKEERSHIVILRGELAALK